MHVATSTVDKLLDYCFNTKEDGLRSINSVRSIYQLIDKNEKYSQIKTDKIDG
jgi:4-O-beta-D-mannosyl-D-glucose phosphorylase